MTPRAAGQGPNTPGFWGYVLAVFISILVVAVSLAAVYVGDEYYGADNPVEFVAWTIAALGYVVLLAVPMAAFVVPTVHLLCFQVPRQWVHVAVTATTSALLGFAVFLVLDRNNEGLPVEAWVMVALIGVATALGRTLVVPLVWRRRSRQIPTRLSATGPV